MTGQTIGSARAFAAIQELVALTAGEWEQAVVRAWVARVGRLLDYEAALEASRTIAETWVGTKPPPYGKWLEVYRSKAAAHEQERQALPESTGPTMSRDDYLDTLRRRAANGDHRAAKELEVWTRASKNILTALSPEAIT